MVWTLCYILQFQRSTYFSWCRRRDFLRPLLWSKLKQLYYNSNGLSSFWWHENSIIRILATVIFYAFLFFILSSLRNTVPKAKFRFYFLHWLTWIWTEQPVKLFKPTRDALTKLQRLEYISQSFCIFFFKLKAFRSIFSRLYPVWSKNVYQFYEPFESGFKIHGNVFLRLQKS